MLTTAPPRIGPKDHGRHMSLKEFEPIQVQEGYIYELARGVIVVSDVPGYAHALQVAETRNQLLAHEFTNPGQIHLVLGTMECKLLMPEWESERHPDLAIYKKPPPVKGKRLWYRWIPDIVIEIVSARSAYREYVEKREEYLSRGVKEYWIIDARTEQVMILRRVRGKWTDLVVKPPDLYETKVLSGFQFDIARVFEAARS